MDAERIDQIKAEISHFVEVKSLCKDSIQKDDVLVVGIDQITDILQNIIRICFTSHNFDKIPSEIADAFDGKGVNNNHDGESNGASDPESPDEDDEDIIKIRQRLKRLKDNAEKARAAQSLLPMKPPRPKKYFYAKKDKDRLLEKQLDPSDQDYAEKWIKEVLDTPRNRYLAEHRAKHGEDALLLDDDPKNTDLKAIEFHQGESASSGTNDGTGKKAPVVRKPHLRSEERADIYTFYLRFSAKYYKSWIYSFISKKYGISQHAFRHILKEVEKKKSFEKGTPTGRSRKLNPEQEEEMITYMKTETGNGTILTTKNIAERYGITRSMAHGYMVRHNIMRLSSKTKRILRLQAENKPYTPWPSKYNKRKQERKRAIKAGLMPPPAEGRGKKSKNAKNPPPPPSEDSNGDLMVQNSQGLDQGSSLHTSQSSGAGVSGLLRSDLLQGMEPDLQLSYNVGQGGHIAHTSNASLSSLSALSNVNKSMSSVFPAFYSTGPSHGSQASMAWGQQMEQMNNITNYNNLVSAQFPNQRDILQQHHQQQQQQQQQYRPH